MANKKKLSFDPGEFEKFQKELERLRVDPQKPNDDSYFNPWNLSKKKMRGKQTICASLPEELPE
ncbi:MAG: hypothetical protein IJX04_06905 [Oscillospiraceae bacterium]|nr:hypothetical protein [Oscillospiraceae bacterium]